MFHSTTSNLLYDISITSGKFCKVFTVYFYVCVRIPRNSSTPQTRHITFPPDIPPDYRSWHSSQVELLRWRSSAGSTASHSSFPTYSISLSLSEMHICKFHVIYEKPDKVSSRFKAFVSTSFSFSLLLPHLSAKFQKPSVDQTYLLQKCYKQIIF